MVQAGRARRREEETYWLSSPPAVVELLSAPQGEGCIKHRVIHGVSNNAMRLWVEALREGQRQTTLRPTILFSFKLSKVKQIVVEQS